MYGGLNIGGLGAQPLSKRDTRLGLGYAKWLAGLNSAFTIRPSWIATSGATPIFQIQTQAGSTIISFSQGGSSTISGASSFGSTLVVGSGGSTLTGIGSNVFLEIRTSANVTVNPLHLYNSSTGTSAAIAFLATLTNASSTLKAAGQIVIGKQSTWVAGDEDSYMAFQVANDGTLVEFARGFNSQGFAVGSTIDPGATNFSVAGISIFGAQVRLKGYLVSTLPAGTQGDTAFCTDLLAPTYLAAAVGGGAIIGPVFYNGTIWVSA